MRASVIVGKYGDTTHGLNLVPVDYVSKAIVALSRESLCIGKSYNIVNSGKVSFNCLMEYLVSSGLFLERKDYWDWTSTLVKCCQTNENLQKLIGPFLDVLCSSFPEDNIFDDSETKAGLLSSHVSLSEITQQTLRNTFLFIKDNIPPIEADLYTKIN